MEETRGRGEEASKWRNRGRRASSLRSRFVCSVSGAETISGAQILSTLLQNKPHAFLSADCWCLVFVISPPRGQVLFP